MIQVSDRTDLQHVTQASTAKSFCLPLIMKFGWSLNGRISSPSVSPAVIVSGRLYNTTITK